MKKIRLNKDTCYNWLSYYSPEHLRKTVGGFKNKSVSLSKTKARKQTVYGTGKNLSKPKTQKIRNLFILEKKKKKLKIE